MWFRTTCWARAPAPSSSGELGALGCSVGDMQAWAVGLGPRCDLACEGSGLVVPRTDLKTWGP